MAELYFKVRADYEKVIRLRTEIDKLKQSLTSMDRAADPRAFAQLERQLQRTSREFDVLVQRAANAAAQMSQTNINVNHINQGLGGLNSTLMKIGGTAALTKFASDVVRVRGEMQMLDKSFEVLLGSKEKSDKMVKQIKDYALISPLSVSDVSKASQTLLGFGTDAEKVIPTLKSIGDITGGNSQRFASLSLAFAQMSAAGKLMGQDLNQMINAGFNPLQTMSEKTGRSIAVLKDEMSKGAITSEMVADAFRQATSEGGKFHGMIEKSADGIITAQNQLQGAIEDTLNAIGEQNEGVITGSYNMATSLVQNYEKIGRALAGLIATYGAYRAAVMLVTVTENLRYQATLAQMAGMTRMQAVMDILRAKTALLNKTMLANPYVLLTVSVVGLVAAMWALSDSTTAAEKAQKQFNDSTAHQKKTIDDLRSSVEGLISTVKSETSTQYDKAKAYKSLQDLMPTIFANMDIEKLKLMDTLSLNKQISEELNRRERIGVKTSAVLRQKELDTINSEISDAERRQGGRSDSVHLRQLNKKKAIAEESVKLANKAVEDIEKLQTEANKPVEKKAEVQNFEHWDKQKKAAETALKDIGSAQKKLLDAGKFDGLDPKVVENYKSQTKLLKEAEKELKVYGSSTKQESAADKLREQNEKLKLIMEKNALELARLEKDTQFSIDQTDIDAKEEGAEKMLAQRDLNHKKELEAIEREAQDKKRKIIESARSDFEADPKNAKKSFDVDTFLLSDKAKKPLALIDNEKQAKTDSLNTAYNRGDYFDDILKAHQDYTDKRLAIEKKYSDDLALLEEGRKKAEETGDKEKIDQFDRAIAQATKDKGKDLMGLDFEKMKESPEYVRAFENLKDTSSETLGSLLEQLEQMKGKAAEVLDPTELREYTSAIEGIISELTERNPFKAIADAQKELSKANLELVKAKRNLRAAEAGGNKEEITAATNAYRNALDNVTKASNKVIKSQKEVTVQMNELYDSLSAVGSSIGGTTGEIIVFIADIGKFVSLTIEGVEKVAGAGAKAISTVEKASIILTIISVAIQLIQKINSLANSLFGNAQDDYEKYAAKVAEINKLTEAVNDYQLAVLEAKQAEDTWFSDPGVGKLKAYKEMNEAAAKAYNDAINADQAKFQEDTGSGWMSWSKKWFHNPLMEISGQRLFDKAFGIDGSNLLAGKSYNESTTKAIDNLRVETRSAKHGLFGSGLGGRSQKTEDLRTYVKKNLGQDLFDDKNMLNLEAAKVALDKYGNKMVGETKATLEKLIELREKYDEYMKQLHEYVSSLYEPLVDNFVDSMWDWFDEGKDALDSFKDYASQTFRDIVSDMIRTIILEKVVGTFSTDINKLYEKYSSGELTETELMDAISKRTAGLISDYEKNIPALQNVMTLVTDSLKGIGLDLKNPESSSQDSTKRGFETMTQDQAGELNGRFTALQMAGEEIKNQSIIQTGLLSSINEKLSLADAMGREMLNTSDLIGKPLTNDSGSNEIPMRIPDYNADIKNLFVESLTQRDSGPLQFADSVQALTVEVSGLRRTVEEMQGVQVNNHLETIGMREGVSILAKNSPKVLAGMEQANRTFETKM